ncbi:MAG: hypothetical protein M3384_20510 [Acidobacteriota bacterium]|nr:hypothetical protein [Acidobacteriota bacterium]
MKNKFAFVLLLVSIAFCGGVLTAAAQTKTKFSYAAQKKFIPAELGQVYLGMPFKSFAGKFDFRASEADDQFSWLQVRTPFKKGNVEEVIFRIHGLSQEEQSAVVRLDKIKVKVEDSDIEYDREIKRLDAAKIPAGKGVVYEINVRYRKGFDLKSLAIKMFGATKDVYKKGDDYHIYDMQWFKKTADGLIWLVRYHEEANILQLSGRIKGTEWDPNA